MSYWHKVQGWFFEHSHKHVDVVAYWSDNAHFLAL